MQSLITFMAGGEEFAANGDALLTVLDIHQGENASELLQLALQYHQKTGEPYAALDLRACLAIGGKIPPQRKMLVIDSKEAKGGLLVDRMVELQTIDERKMQYIIYPTELRRGIVVIRHAFYASKLLQCIDYTQILKSAVTSGVPTSHL